MFIYLYYWLKSNCYFWSTDNYVLSHKYTQTRQYCVCHNFKEIRLSKIQLNPFQTLIIIIMSTHLCVHDRPATTSNEKTFLQMKLLPQDCHKSWRYVSSVLHAQWWSSSTQCCIIRCERLMAGAHLLITTIKSLQCGHADGEWCHLKSFWFNSGHFLKRSDMKLYIMS